MSEIELAFIYKLIAVFLSLITIIAFVVFFIMSNTVGQIRREVSNLFYFLNNEMIGKTYKCKNCGFVSNVPHDFCPICEKNNQGKTVSELRSDYRYKKRVNRP
ncbi:MAG: hypothetical protein KAU83_03990 [Bacteroidales bacterium]|nr:hypothetical protein [Bacteroidales bacterium]